MRPAKKARAGALLPALALAAVLALAGCGGGDGSSETATGTSTSAEAEMGSDAGEAQGNGGKGSGEGKQSAGDGSSGKVGTSASQPNGEPEPGVSPEQRRKATTADITLESPGLASGGVLSAKYTCDGGNESPPLKWTGLPDEAAELVLFVLNFQPVDEALFFNWAVAGIDPGLEEIEEGELPSGAVAGKNSFGENGYGLCPPDADKSESYFFMLYAIPEALSPEEGFDPLPLREEVLAQHGNVGLLGTSYKRD